MNSDIAIKVDNVSKKFCKKLKKSMLYGTMDVTRNALGIKNNSERLRSDEFWAINDASFEVKKGETLGLIGPNGSGKTTLLKMLNGIFWPDKGKISIRGRVGALIAVGAGFHQQLTGRENIYVNAAILGMNRREINKRFDQIVEFADIGDFLDTPVKYYSSGMFVRLGFAIAVHCEPNVLLVDEVLAVGDIGFQSKCFNRLGKLRENGITTILVSHSMQHILGFCDKVFYANGGKRRYYGATDKAVEIYQEDMSVKKNLPCVQFGVDEIMGSGKVKITRAEFLKENEILAKRINAKDFSTLRLFYSADEDIGPVELDVAIKIGNDIFFKASSKAYDKELIIHKGKGYIDTNFKNLQANNQTLLFTVALWQSDRTELFDCKREIPLFVVGNFKSSGRVLLDIDWTLCQYGELTHDVNL
ncbi:ABC transporter ATP-binding protein [Candidatus Omnitrophota bacterium]